MSAPIGPGDFVECVDARPNLSFGPNPLRLGAVYRVTSVQGEGDWHRLYGWSQGGLFLAEVKTRAPWGFAIERFRPIYSPKQSLIRDLLQPVKEDA